MDNLQKLKEIRKARLKKECCNNELSEWAIAFAIVMFLIYFFALLGRLTS